MSLYDTSGYRRPRRPVQEITHLFANETRALIAQCAFVLAMPTLIVLLVVTKSLLWAGLGWVLCLAIVIACWALPRRKNRTPMPLPDGE